MPGDVRPRSLDLLCSRRDPIREAHNWLNYYANFIASGLPVCILGAGAGYHIEEFTKRFPEVPFEVIEIDEAIKLEDRKIVLISSIEQAVEFIKGCEQFPLILPFRPSWQGMYEEYSRAFSWLTLRDPSALKFFDREFSGCRFANEILNAQSLKKHSSNINSERKFHLVSIVGELLA